MKSVEVAAKTRELAIQDALRKLGAERHEIEVEVLDEGSPGLFGIMSRPVRLRVSVESDDVPDRDDDEGRPDDRRERPARGRGRGGRRERGPRIEHSPAALADQERKREARPESGPAPATPRPASGTRGDRGPRPERPHPDRGQRQDRGPRPERGPRPDRGQRQERGPRPETGDRTPRAEQPPRGEQQGRPPRERRPRRDERRPAEQTARPERAERPERRERQERREPRPERAERQPREAAPRVSDGPVPVGLPKLDAYPDAESENRAKSAAALCEEVVRLLGVEASVTDAPVEEAGCLLQVSSPDSAILIGRKGRNLESLQYIVNRMVRKEEGDEGDRIIIDVEGYHDRRRASLQEMALDMAARVKSTGRRMRVRPLIPQERRIVHMTLQDDPDIRTFSVGSGAARTVIIAPAKEDEQEDRPQRGGAPRGRRGGRSRGSGEAAGIAADGESDDNGIVELDDTAPVEDEYEDAAEADDMEDVDDGGADDRDSLG